jgi:hypothetical protein
VTDLESINSGKWVIKIERKLDFSVKCQYSAKPMNKNFDLQFAHHQVPVPLGVLLASLGSTQSPDATGLLVSLCL